MAAMFKKWRKLKIAAFMFCVVLLLPELPVIPVEGATTNDWNAKSFWFEPWGKSGVHKGIDIFGKMNTPVLATTYGVVLFSGDLALGGKVVAVLGPKWRLHYYAHLSSGSVLIGEPVCPGKKIAHLGDSGNVKGKPPHVHYAVVTLVPYVWLADASSQGWKKMFYLNPAVVLTN